MVDRKDNAGGAEDTRRVRENGFPLCRTLICLSVQVAACTNAAERLYQYLKAHRGPTFTKITHYI